MKYIKIILLFICILTSATLYFLWPETSSDTANVAVTINGRTLAKSTVQAMGAENGNGHYSSEYAVLLKSAITRELLIQEAQRQHLDKTEEFQASLKTYYEESLIKTLLDRQYAKPVADITDTEVDAYLSFFGKRVTFSRFNVADNDAESSDDSSLHLNEVLFDDLAQPMKILIAGLKPGEHAVKYDTSSEQYAIRLVRVEEATGVESTHLPARERVREMLREHKQLQQIGNWLNELHNKASIKFHNGQTSYEENQ